MTGVAPQKSPNTKPLVSRNSANSAGRASVAVSPTWATTADVSSPSMAPTTEIRSTGRCPHAAARRPQNELTTTTPEALTAITTPMASSLKPSSRASGARIGVTICWPTIRPNTARQTSKIGFLSVAFGVLVLMTTPVADRRGPVAAVAKSYFLMRKKTTTAQVVGTRVSLRPTPTP